MGEKCVCSKCGNDTFNTFKQPKSNMDDKSVYQVDCAECKNHEFNFKK